MNDDVPSIARGVTRDDCIESGTAQQLKQTPPGAHMEYGDIRVTIVDSGVALLTTSYTGTMTIVLIRTNAGWRFLAGQS